MPLYEPMPLARMREPFDHPDWLFELKYDGFRALLFLGRYPEFVSRSGIRLLGFAEFARDIDHEVARTAVLDGEIVCLDRDAAVLRPHVGRGAPCFVAFDLLALEDRDLRELSD